MVDPQELYDTLTDDLLYDPLVERSTMMGYPCVRRSGQFFAAFDRRASALVVKLPAGRVTELIEAGAGQAFTPNGRTFREWVVAPVPDPALWDELLDEAKQFSATTARASKVAIDALADRIRDVLAELAGGDVREQRMFGGQAFLVGGRMVVAASREGGLLVSVDRAGTEALLSKPHVGPMVMRGKQLAGWVRVDSDGIRTRRQLTTWITRGLGSSR